MKEFSAVQQEEKVQKTEASTVLGSCQRFFKQNTTARNNLRPGKQTQIVVFMYKYIDLFMSPVWFLNEWFTLPKLLLFSRNTQTYRATNWPTSLATTHNATVSGESAADEEYMLWHN